MRGVEEKEVRRQHGEEVEVRMFIDTRALPLMVMSGDVWGCRVVRAREGKVVLRCSSEGLIQRRMLLPCPALPCLLACLPASGLLPPASCLPACPALPASRESG